MKGDVNFIGYLHSFRGFAILNVVLVHAIVAPLLAMNEFNLDLSDPVAMTNEVLFHDSTIYFALISGLLFSAILQKRGYAKFYRSKFLYVFLPYLFFTLLFSIFKPPSEDGFASLHTNIAAYLSSASLNLLMGTAQFTYWYLPVLFFLFAITPLLDWVMNPKRFGIWPTVLILSLPLVFSRTSVQITPGTLVYFTGSYAFGIFLGQNLEQKLNWFRPRSSYLLIIAILTSVALFFLLIIDYDYLGFVSLRESIFYIQKLALAVIIILWLKARGAQQPKWLDGLASDAFAIYFMHMFFIFLCFGIAFPLLQLDIYPFDIFISSIIMIIVSVGLSRLIVFGMHKALGKKSRMIIGS